MTLTLTENTAQYAERLRHINSVENNIDKGAFIEFDFEDDPLSHRDLLKKLINEGFRVCGFVEKEIDLQKIYIDKYAPEENKWNSKMLNSKEIYG